MKPDHKQLRVRVTEHQLPCLQPVPCTTSKHSPLIHPQHRQPCEQGTVIIGSISQMGDEYREGK